MSPLGGMVSGYRGGGVGDSGGGGGALPTVVSHVSSVNLATTATINTTGATILIIGVSWHITEGTVSDSKSNTWTQGILRQGDPSRQGVRIWYAANPTVGTGHTFSASGMSAGVLAVVAVAGIVTTSPYDQQNGSSFAGDGTTTTRSSGSVTPTQNREFLVAFYGIDDPSGSTFSVDSGFTILEQADVNPGAWHGGVLATLAQSTAAAINPTLTRSVAGTSGKTDNSVIATFKAA